MQKYHNKLCIEELNKKLSKNSNKVFTCLISKKCTFSSDLVSSESLQTRGSGEHWRAGARALGLGLSCGGEWSCYCILREHVGLVFGWMLWGGDSVPSATCFVPVRTWNMYFGTPWAKSLWLRHAGSFDSSVFYIFFFTWQSRELDEELLFRWVFFS